MGTRIGRDDELAQALAAVYAVLSGHAATVVVEGEPGIGKSDLLQGLVGAAEALGFRVLRAEADETTSEVPFGVVDQLLASVSVTRVGVAPLPVAAEMLQLVDDVGRDEQLCVVVEDAHWCDPQSAETLAYLVERLELDPVLLLVTARAGSDGFPAQLTRHLAAGAAGVHLELRGLSPEQLGRLAEAEGVPGMSPDTLQQLWERTGGNPLYARHVLHTLGAGPTVEIPQTLTVPRQIADAVQAELVRHPPRIRALIDVLAVAAHPLPTGALAQVVDDHPRALLELLSDAEPLVEGDGTAVWLRSAILREVAREALPTDRLQALHGVLARHVTGTERLRHLVAAAPAEGDEHLALELEAEADRAVDRGDYAEGARHLLSAATVSPDVDDRDRRFLEAGFLVGIAEDLPLARRLAPGIVSMEPCAERDLLIAGLHFFNGDYADGEVVSREIQDAVPKHTSQPVFARRVAVLLASILSVWGNETAALEAIETVPDFVPSGARIPATDGVTDRMHRLQLAHALWANGRVPDAIAVLDGVVRGEPETPEFAEALMVRGRVRFYTGHMRAALDDLERGLAAARARGVPAALRRGMAEQSVIELHLGEWGAAMSHANLVITLSTENGDLRGMAAANAVSAMLAVARGDDATAATHLEWLRTHVTTTSPALGQLHTAAAEMWIALARDDPGSVLRTAARLGATRIPAWSDRIGLVAWRALPVVALTRLGRLAEAQAALAEFAARAYERPAAPLPFGHPAWLEGQLAEASGDPEVAGARYSRALQLSHGLPHAHAQVHLSLGDLHRRRGDHADAERSFRAAHTELMGIGAFASAAAAASRLARPPDPSGSPAYSTLLTSRERDVAHLLAQTKSNREIAAELFLSLKTVEFHVSNIITKLGLRSRRDLWGTDVG